MKTKKKDPGSFRFGLTLATLLCWILPILIVSSTAGYLLNANFSDNLRHSVDADASNAIQIAGVRLLTVIEDSKAVSYDGVVRQAYRDYLKGGVAFNVYRSTMDYLSQRFSHDPYCRAAFISFLDPKLDFLPYAAAPGSSRLGLAEDYGKNVLPAVRKLMAQKDTGIFFLSFDESLFMVRNLMDSNFDPFAMLVIELDKGELLQSLYGINNLKSLEVMIDSVPISLEGKNILEAEGSFSTAEYSTEADGHLIVCRGRIEKPDVLKTVPSLRWALLAVILLVIPLLVLIIWLFYRNVNHPIELLIEANSRVQSGERGYIISEDAPNSEFTQLYAHFNSMSGELDSQFRRLVAEQQALQQAKIKALQSQINPHFLNNTLEIINWEARLADNERVCSMIEALSIMLDAAIGRDDRSQVLLSEELKYVEAYLYITQERLGDRLSIVREIEPDMLGQHIPLLLIQPIIENAVEYDLSRKGGELSLRAYSKGSDLYFEVEHDGEIDEKGWRRIQNSLGASPVPGEKGSVGLRNVSNRLALIYGSGYRFEITEPRRGRVLAQIVLINAKMPNQGNN